MPCAANVKTFFVLPRITSGMREGGGIVRVFVESYGTMSDDDLSAEENRHIGAQIREELARRRISRQHLADKAKISLSTLEKALTGSRPFTLASVVRIEEALQRPLRQARVANKQETDLAPEHLGSYSHPAVAWFEGDYVTLRPSFSDAQSIYAYRTEIRWDHALSHLVFRESDRLDAAFKQDGAVSVPHQSGYIYLVTNKMGQYRLIILSRPMIGGEMYGLLTTLQSGRGTLLTPVSTPIVLVPLKSFEAEPQFGKFNADAAVYAAYQAILKRATEEPFVLLVK
jgi:transcriptional regulator with XRE-family HTH domain